MSAASTGLERARALSLPASGGYAGSIDLGLQLDARSAVGYLETVQRLKKDKLELAAFAQGWAGMTRFGDRWERDFGAVAGLRGTW